MSAGDWLSDDCRHQAVQELCHAVPPLRITLRLAISTSLLVLDRRALLFIERTQELNEINTAAARLIDLLADGIVLDHDGAICLPTIPHDCSVDASSLAQVLCEWSALGMIDTDWFLPSFPPPNSVFLQAGTVCVGIYFSGAELAQILGRLYAHLPTIAPTSPSLLLRIDICQLGELALIKTHDGSTIIVPARQISSRLHNILLQHLLDADGLVLLHAACVDFEGHAMLICGPPGMGKSTMTQALLPDADAICGDDVVIFDPASGCVMAVPFPLTFKEGGWALARARNPALTDREAEIRADGVPVRYQALPDPAKDKWLEVRHIVKLDRVPTGAAALDQLTELEALTLLISEARSADGRSSVLLMEKLASLVARASRWLLTYSESDEAAGLLVRSIA